MALEIERKFLVAGDFKSEAFRAIPMKQGYLNTDPLRTVRVRVAGERGFITVKSKGSAVTHFEWEKEIPASEALGLLECAEPGVIEKTRYLVAAGDGVHTWEVDEFHGDNEGLVVAEIELSSEDEDFPRPAWLGPEVTADPRYYNSYLSGNPYRGWPSDSPVEAGA